MVEGLPAGFYVVADPAYIPTEHVLTPYSGANRVDEWNAIFNFYLSQIRIRIEMAFGQMTTQWRILRSPIVTSLENAAKAIECCARLQNFCISEDHEDSTGIEICTVDALTENDVSGTGYTANTARGLMTIDGNSTLCNVIRQSIMDNGFQRPSHNIVRNKIIGNLEIQPW